MKNLLLIFALITAISSKGQNGLIDLGNSGSGFLLRLDTSTIKLEDKDKQIYSVTVTGLLDTAEIDATRIRLAAQYKKDQLNQAVKAELIYYVDCLKSKVALCRTTYLDASGATLHSISYCEYDKSYEKVKDGTMRKQLKDAVCAAKR
jgi:hypothetical protein